MYRSILFQLYCDFQWNWLACYEDTTFSCTSDEKKEQILNEEKRDFRYNSHFRGEGTPNGLTRLKETSPFGRYLKMGSLIGLFLIFNYYVHIYVHMAHFGGHFAVLQKYLVSLVQRAHPAIWNHIINPFWQYL
jgi:hypothetical protein